MDHPRKKRASPSVMDGDGVRVTEHGSRRSRSALFYKVFAVMLAGAGAGAGYWLIGTPASPDAGNRDTRNTEIADIDQPASDRPDIATMQSAALQTTAVPRRDVTPPVEPGRDLSLDLAQVIPPGVEPTAAEVIDELHKAGIHSGIGAFNPPGTSPPLIGLAVPDGFELPEGYVRHFQATDDGQRIEPILMYSPDFDFFDAAGKPIAIPPDRVVPPGMAPPGLAIRRIDIPPPLQPGTP
jgi:hypothetical protein